MLKSFYFLILFLVFFSCNNNEKINIKGNWYTANFNPHMMDSINNEDDINFYYEEVFLTDNVIYSYSNVQGFLSPYMYKLKKDSLSISYGINGEFFDYRGKVKTVDNNHFILINSENKEDHFFRLINVENSLDKFISFKDSINPVFEQKGTLFSQEFIYRSEKKYSEIK